MRGMDARNGVVLDDIEHLQQSIHDILSTPIGSRLMRRDYGSRIMELMDRPMNAELVADLQAAVVMSITTHEPRLQLTKVEVRLADDDVEIAKGLTASGKLLVKLEGYYVPEGRYLVFENIGL